MAGGLPGLVQFRPSLFEAPERRQATAQCQMARGLGPAALALEFLPEALQLRGHLIPLLAHIVEGQAVGLEEQGFHALGLAAEALGALGLGPGPERQRQPEGGQGQDDHRGPDDDCGQGLVLPDALAPSIAEARAPRLDGIAVEEAP